MKTARTIAATIIGLNIGFLFGIVALFAYLANGRLEDDADWNPWDDDAYDLLSIEPFGDVEYDPIDSLFEDDEDAWDDGVH